jgi:hypothetical protein
LWRCKQDHVIYKWRSDRLGHGDILV